MKEKNNFDYYYNCILDEQIKLSNFLIMPAELFTNSKFKYLSLESKVLFACIIDKINVPNSKNKVEIYVDYSSEEVANLVKCDTDNVIILFQELAKIGLIDFTYCKENDNFNVIISRR